MRGNNHAVRYWMLMWKQVASRTRKEAEVGGHGEVALSVGSGKPV